MENKKPHHRIDWWNLLFSFFFVFLMYLGYRLSLSAGGLLHEVSFWDATIMALATFRLSRLVVYDSITRWVRAFFDDAEEFTFMGTVKTLINCPWCVGLWFALVVSTAYFTSPFLWFFIFVLALGGVGSFIQLVANFVGWSAEYKKHQAQNKKS